jgi:phage I-like protein
MYRTYEKIDFDKIDNSKKEHWLKIFPRGEVYIEKYDRTENINDAFMNSMIEAFNDEKLSKPKMDNDHEFGVSYADILELQKRDDGLYGRILLNDLGYEAIKNRHYSYISPAFGERTGTDKTVYPNSLSAISLVNYPALEGSIGDVQSQIKLSKGEIMNLEQKLEMLNAKVSEIEKVQLSKDGKAVDNTIVKETFELAKEAIGKVSELEKLNKDVNDKLLSKETELNASKTELSKIKEDELKKEAESVVKQAIEDGQFHPALNDMKIKAYILDKNTVIDELKVIPKVEKKGQQTFSGAGVKTLSKDEIAIAESLGLKTDDPKVIEAIKKSEIKSEDK